jgi:hypothetical protein
MCTTIHGDPITMADGFGILFAGGPGALMSHGDGVFPTTADGIGEWDWGGTGYPIGVGGLLGCIGIMEPIMSGGAR